MKKPLICLFTTIVIFAITLSVYNVQAKTTIPEGLCRFTMADGLVIVGKAELKEDVVYITTQDNNITIRYPEADIKSVVKVNDVVEKVIKEDLIIKTFPTTKITAFEVSTGMAATTGNKDTVVGNLEVNTIIATPEWRLTNRIYADYGGKKIDKDSTCPYYQNGDDTVDELRITTIYDYMITGRFSWYAKNFISRQYNAGVDFNTYVVSGIGYHPFDTENTKLSLHLGVGMQGKWYTSDCEDIGGIVQGSVLFEQKITDKLAWHTDIDATYAVFSNNCKAIDCLDWEIRHDSYLRYKVKKDLPLFLDLGVGNTYHHGITEELKTTDTTVFGRVTYRF